MTKVEEERENSKGINSDDNMNNSFPECCRLRKG